jgi:hypothetical protein
MKIFKDKETQVWQYDVSPEINGTMLTLHAKNEVNLKKGLSSKVYMIKHGIQCKLCRYSIVFMRIINLFCSVSKQSLRNSHSFLFEHAPISSPAQIAGPTKPA